MSAHPHRSDPPPGLVRVRGARRPIDRVGVPDVDSIEGLPPAVALQQRRGTPNARSTVGGVTTLSSWVRMLYSRAGSYPPEQTLLCAEDFSPVIPQGACPTCHGLGRVGRFSFNVAKGRCETCEGEGLVSVELPFMPSVDAPCPACHGARFDPATLEVTWHAAGGHALRGEPDRAIPAGRWPSGG